MEVLIHIGDAKCGSSSIQASLFQMRDALLEQGILYHPASPSNGHFGYITLLNGKTRGDNTEQEAQSRRNIAETRALIHEHKPAYLLLSGESLFSVPPDLLAGLLEEICGTLPPIHIIAFLRHPVDFYLSGVQQGLKGNHEFIAPTRFIRDTPGTFRRWSAFPACRSMTARLFDRSRLTGGSVVSEFSAILRGIVGQTFPELPDANRNTSLSAEQMILLQQFRRDFLADSKGRFCPQSNWLIRFFEELNEAVGMIGARPALRDDVRACIQDQNARFTEELDQIFPDLGMMKSRSIAVTDWQATAGQWTRDVSSILRDFDAETVQALRSMLPDYNSGQLDPKVLSTRLAALQRGSQVRRPYLRYLTWCGHAETAAQLRALTAGA